MSTHEMYEIIEEENKAPVRVGQVITQLPTGKSKEDPFLSIHGYILFIKGMPMQHLEDVVKVRVTAVKPRFGFAQFIKAERE